MGLGLGGGIKLWWSLPCEETRGWEKVRLLGLVSRVGGSAVAKLDDGTGHC